MRLLVVGSGGREHALVWKLAQSRLADKVFCAPGNGGISQHAECVPIKADDIEGLLSFARKEKIGLTVVGPEAPLALGIADEFQKAKQPVFGPNRQAAQLEASKVFAKQLLLKYKVPTAPCVFFDDPAKAMRYVEQAPLPCVVKADGLAQGKGVVVASTQAEAIGAVKAMMQDKIFGRAGSRIIVEECLRGQEASIIVLTDSRDVIALASSQDHKRVYDNDEGPNTGGMGAYSPAPVVTPALQKTIMETIIHRTIDGLVREGIEYRGVLYAGIMITPNGPQVLEFNVRFGDPETQAILPRLKSDLLETMLATSGGKVSSVVKSGGLQWDTRACVCVVATSGGYPGTYVTGKEIFGLEDASRVPDTMLFHAGTTVEAVTAVKTGAGRRYMTNGGRVLGVAGLGTDIAEAQKRAYQAIGKIEFEGMHYRRDIAHKAL